MTSARDARIEESMRAIDESPQRRGVTAETRELVGTARYALRAAQMQIGIGAARSRERESCRSHLASGAGHDAGEFARPNRHRHAVRSLRQRRHQPQPLEIVTPQMPISPAACCSMSCSIWTSLVGR